MNLELTTEQQSALLGAILTRVRMVKSLIDGWVKFPDEHSDYLIEVYTKELEALLELEKKVI